MVEESQVPEENTPGPSEDSSAAETPLGAGGETAPERADVDEQAEPEASAEPDADAEPEAAEPEAEPEATEPEMAASAEPDATAPTHQSGSRFLAWVRSQLPDAFQRRLSDGALALLLAVAVLLVLLLLNSLVNPRPSVRVVTAPPAATAADEVAAPAPPDADRIAEIQKQVTDLATPYGEGLVTSVQVNFARQRLTLTLSNAWYRLSAAQQDELAAKWLARSRSLQFTGLTLRSPDDNLLARSPVVGPSMIIVQRQPPPSSAEEPSFPEESALTEAAAPAGDKAPPEAADSPEAATPPEETPSLEAAAEEDTPEAPASPAEDTTSDAA